MLMDEEPAIAVAAVAGARRDKPGRRPKRVRSQHHQPDHLLHSTKALSIRRRQVSWLRSVFAVLPIPGGQWTTRAKTQVATYSCGTACDLHAIPY